MKPDSPALIRTTPLILGVALEIELAHALRALAEGSGLRFRNHEAAQQLLEGSVRGQAGCIVMQSESSKLSELHEDLDRLHLELAQLPVIIVTRRCAAQQAVDLMRRGVFSVLEAPVDADQLRQTIDDATQWSTESQNACEESANALMRMKEASGKELEVLDLVMNGLKNKEISEKLGITVRAVEDRRIRLMKKLHVDSLPELIELAVVYRRARREERLAGRIVRSAARPRRFVRGIEVWQPDADSTRLVLVQSSYRDAQAMEHVSRDLSFAMDDGLPGDVWRSRAPVFYRNLTSGPFVRGAAAAAAGLTTGIGFPVFGSASTHTDAPIQSIVLLLLDGGESLTTAIEHWRVASDRNRLELHGGVYANCERLRRLSEQLSMPAGVGLAGFASDRRTPYLGARFAEDSVEIRGVALAAEKLISGMALPMLSAAERAADVLTVFNSSTTPLFRLMQFWQGPVESGPCQLLTEIVDGDRSLPARCGVAGERLSDDCAALLAANAPQVVSSGRQLRQLAPESLPFEPTVGLMIPCRTERCGQAMVVLLD